MTYCCRNPFHSITAFRSNELQTQQLGWRYSSAAMAAGRPTAAAMALNHGNTCERSHPSQTDGSTVVQVAALQAYIAERDRTQDGFVLEFRNIPNETSSMHVSKHPASWPRNRYTNLWTYDHNRVLLDTDDDDPSDYINASYIAGYKGRAYVAAQGPIKTTIGDTWRMIWQLKTNRVVMLTKLFHCGMNVCEMYWPSSIRSSKDYGKFAVTTLACDIYSDYTVRTFLVTYQGESRQITHFHFTAWVDEGVPTSTHPLLAFRRLVRSFDDRSTGPIIVHCSGGVGRTGTFIALDSLLDMGQAKGKVDIFSFACHLRTERMDMVETYDQYVFLHHALLDGLQTGHLAYPVSQYPDVYRTLCLDDEHMTELKTQFQMLEVLNSSSKSKTGCDGQQTHNSHRRRWNDTTADYNNQLHTQRESAPHNESLKSVCVDSFRQANGYLLTQMPLPDTAVDFWRLVYDHKCPTIITLLEVNSQRTYWPSEDVSVKSYGKLTVTRLGEHTSTVEDVVERVFSVYLTTKPKNAHKVKQYQLMSGWPKTDRLPSRTSTLLSLIELVNRPVSEDDHIGPVILQCMDGASRSGLFCAASHLLGSLTVDQYVDVFHSAQHVRNKRPQAIDSLEEYKFLHRLAADYLSQQST